MNPLITDDMVEIGALASVNTSLTSYGYDALTTLEGLPGRIEFCAEMRAALEAAAPLIAANIAPPADRSEGRRMSAKWDNLTVERETHGYHVIVATLDPDEAENIAHALGLHDVGARDLLAAAAECRRLDEEDEC